MHGNFRIRTAGIAEVLAITQYTRESQLGLCRVLDLLELLEHKKSCSFIFKFEYSIININKQIC